VAERAVGARSGRSAPGWLVGAWRGRRPLPLVASAVLVLAASFGLISCSGDDIANGASLEQRLVAAKEQLDASPSVRFVLSTDELPEGLAGLLEADGVGTHAPAFQGDIKVSQSGLSVEAKVVAVDTDVYAKISFSPVYTRIDPADYGAPDPARLMDEKAGISSLLTAATMPADAGERREGADVLQSISATIPGSAVAGIFPSAASTPFAATFDLTDTDQLRSAEITGRFYSGEPPVTYTLELTSYGERVEISPP
jgi:lipoprotein LprG